MQQPFEPIEAVTVSVGYGDFLKVTLPRNLPLFDRMIVVTSPDDMVTREVCRRHSVQTVVTDEHDRDGEFSKGRLINKGLDQLLNKGWVVHVDADILLPQRFRQVVQTAHLDPAALYGCDRVMVRTHAQWVKLRDSGFLHHDYHCRVNFPEGFDTGARWADDVHGYCPIGFFQMWHHDSHIYRGHHHRRYPCGGHDAARGDVQFAIQWDRRKRHLLPEVIAVHLESQKAALGANWKGRTTPPFEAAH